MTSNLENYLLQENLTTKKSHESEETETLKEDFLSVKFDNMAVTDRPASIRVKHVITLSETRVLARKSSKKLTKKSTKNCLIRKSKLAYLPEAYPPRNTQIFGDSFSESLRSFEQISLVEHEKDGDQGEQFKGPAFNNQLVNLLDQ